MTTTLKKSTPPRSPRPKKSTPPPDNPAERHYASKLDRLIGSEEHDMAKERVIALSSSLLLAQPAFDGPTTPTPGVSNWVQVGPVAITNGQTYGGSRVLVTGRVTAIVTHPTNSNIIYVGTAQGGVWKTTDGGINWTPKTDNEVSLAVGALALDPTDPQILYVGTGEGNFSGDSYYGNGVLKSSNGGDSWTLLAGTTFQRQRFGRIAVNPSTPTTLYAAVGNGLYRTTNGGTTWTLQTSGLPSAACTDVIINQTSSDTAYAAFWGQGIYRTVNANAASPAWTQLTTGLPTASSPAPNGFFRVALGISRTAPLTVYALFCNNDSSTPSSPTYYQINKFYISNDGGDHWTNIPLPSGNIGGQGFYNLNVAVDPTTPDIIYLSGVSVWKAARNAVTNAWTITQIGANIHPDNHAFAFDPTDHLVIYAGSDGGIYKSTDGGATWIDRLNRGICITQFEFIDQHPTLDAVVIGGTQDNGTEQFRNSTVFYHADDGDGGFVAVDFNNPVNVLSTYYGNSPKRSTQAGKFGSWVSVGSGIVGGGLFYPPMAIDQTNPSNVAFGTDRINLDSSQGTGGWPGSGVSLPGIGTGQVSAINYVNSNLIYAGTKFGQVYRLVQSGGTWTATALQVAPLPTRYIWDIGTLPADPNTLVVVMSGFGTPHVWRGQVATGGASATWTAINGSGVGQLPDIPVNALVIDPADATGHTLYVGTDVGVFRTTDFGANWILFSDALPNVAINDLKLHNPTRLLRAATHGRGLWERKLDAATLSDVNLYIRDHAAATDRQLPTPSGIPAPFEDPLQHINLGDLLWPWQCADLKVDALEGTPPAYQMSVADVDYLTFETQLVHRNAQRGRTNRVYAHVRNRGIVPAVNVTVKVLFTDATAGLPQLPSDFWAVFPNDSALPSVWTPIGPAQIIPALSPTEPTILSWNWNTPPTAATHSCLLMLMDSPDDPIPGASKITDVGSLIGAEKRFGLKNLHVVDALPGAEPMFVSIRFFGNAQDLHTLRLAGSTVRNLNIGFVLPTILAGGVQGEGIKQTPLPATLREGLRKHLADRATAFDFKTYFVPESVTKGGSLQRVKLPKEGVEAVLVLSPSGRISGEQTLSIIQQNAQGVVTGGSTFVVRPVKARP